MIVWLLSADYFFTSQLQGDLQRSGFEMQQVSDGESLQTKFADGCDSVVVIDLSLPNLDLGLIEQIRSIDNPPKDVIAFGPHVAEEKLKAARAAGCDQVLTKGQAHRELGATIQNLVGA